MELSAVLRLTRLELRKLFKGKALYIVAFILVFFAGVSTTGWDDDYRRTTAMFRDQMNNSITNLEQMAKLPINITHPPVVIIGGGFPGTGSPPQIDFENRPLKDTNGNLIPENLEYYKQLYTDFYEGEIGALTEEGGQFSLGSLMGQGATQVGHLIPILGVALAVGLFAGDFRGGYRLMVSRGVRRSNLMTAKVMTVIALAMGLTTLFTAALFLSGLASASNIGGAGLAGLSSSTIAHIFGVALLMFAAYMLVGGVVGTVMTSPSAAMGVGLVLAFISSSFFFMLTPEDDFFLAKLSPISLGYNFNSLMYYVWRAGEESSRYRDVIPSIAIVAVYAGIYISLIYGVFSKKQLRG